ncbi:MAG: HD-GYP domain-containing protein, partial [Deltaproteobacteria bacterium]|nr:HD-GYP domain-containing protein [Deltaproteobacteria bacterium]
FERGVTRDELSSLLDILTREREVEPLPEELEKEVRSAGIKNIILKSIPKDKKSFLEVYNDAVKAVKGAMNEVRTGKIPKTSEVKSVVTHLTDMVLSDTNAMIGLAMIKNYDEYLYNHSVNVSIFAISLGRFMNLDEKNLHVLGMAGLLHDIGKTGVAEDIIRKPGNLSSEEWEKIKQHPVLGSEITSRMEGMDGKVPTVIYEHHIRYDYSGYPKEKRRLDPLSLIISVADAYDALTTLRVYQKPTPPVEAMRMLRDLAGKHFDPKTVTAFQDMIGFYPVGTMVRLSTNEVGVVTGVSPGTGDQPVVKILYNNEGRPLDEPFNVDLSQKNPTPRIIVGTVDPLSKNMDLGELFAKEAG